MRFTEFLVNSMTHGRVHANDCFSRPRTSLFPKVLPDASVAALCLRLVYSTFSSSLPKRVCVGILDLRSRRHRKYFVGTIAAVAAVAVIGTDRKVISHIGLETCDSGKGRRHVDGTLIIAGPVFPTRLSSVMNGVGRYVWILNRIPP